MSDLMALCPRCRTEVWISTAICPGCQFEFSRPAAKKHAGGGTVAVILLVACGLGFMGRLSLGSTSASSLDYGQAQQTIEDLESGRVLSAKHCGPTTTARFDRRAWHRLTETQQRGVMLIISRVCSERGHATSVTLYDDQTGDFLADFNGR